MSKLLIAVTAIVVFVWAAGDDVVLNCSAFQLSVQDRSRLVAILRVSYVASYIRLMPAFDVFSNSQACVIQGQSTICAKA